MCGAAEQRQAAGQQGEARRLRRLAGVAAAGERGLSRYRGTAMLPSPPGTSLVTDMRSV